MLSERLMNIQFTFCVSREYVLLNVLTQKLSGKFFEVISTCVTYFYLYLGFL